MIKFSDDESNNKEKNELFAKFIKALRKVDFIDDNGSINIGKIAKDRNWPKTLDIENFEIDSIMADALVGNAGGDWQMATWFTVYYNKRKDKVDLIMFEDGSNGTGKKQSFSKVKKEIQKILSGEVSESDDDKSEKLKDKASSHFFSEEELRKLGKEYIEKLEKEELDESKSGDTRTLKKYFKEFNKKFFNDEIPDMEIKLTNKDTEHSKGVAGSFNYFKDMKSIHSNKSGKHFNLDDLRNSNHRDDEEERAFNYFVEHSYIELPKDVVTKGKYYFCSVLLHEMTHAWVNLCSKSHDKDPHGPTFRKKVDEINRKSNNEYRVAYEEVPQELVSDKPINERPEDISESKLIKIDLDKYIEAFSLIRSAIYKKHILTEDTRLAQQYLDNIEHTLDEANNRLRMLIKVDTRLDTGKERTFKEIEQFLANAIYIYNEVRRLAIDDPDFEEITKNCNNVLRVFCDYLKRQLNIAQQNGIYYKHSFDDKIVNPEEIEFDNFLKYYYPKYREHIKTKKAA